VLVLLGLAGGAGTYYYWRQSLTALPAGIVASNGRLEADEIDISTKFAGRVADLLTTEGSMVKAGQIIARMDTRDLEASLKRAEAQVLQSQRVVEEVRAIREQQVTQVALASQQLERTKYLWDRGNTTRELLDQRQQQYDAANAALNAANARIAQAEHALVAATNETELLKINIADNTLVAPREGRIQYRIANVGEVLPAGGKVFTMIDINSVYMTSTCRPWMPAAPRSAPRRASCSMPTPTSRSRATSRSSRPARSSPPRRSRPRWSASG
jgi:HlyD family secretion protein